MAAASSTILDNVYARSVTWPFKWIFWGLTFLSISWCLAILFACTGHLWLWRELGAEGSLEQVNRAWVFLIGDSLGTVEVSSGKVQQGAHLLFWCSEKAYEVIFIWTGFEKTFFMAVSGMAADGLDKAFYRYLATHRDTVEVAMMATRLWGAKLALVFTSAPLFLAAFAVAVVDGLVLRHIRTVNGGRESSTLYHRSKYLSVMLAGTTMMLILLLPINIYPSIVLPLLALCTGFFARVQWQYFKKYI